MFALLPPLPVDQIGSYVLFVILVVHLANQIKKLLGWDRPSSETNATKGEVGAVKKEVSALSEKLSAQVALCATKEEVFKVRDEITDKYDKLEQYSHNQAHDTINALNSVQLNLEKLRVELVREMASANQRIEDRINELVLGRPRKENRREQ